MLFKQTIGAIVLVAASATASMATTITETFEGFADGVEINSLAGLTVSAENGGTARTATASFPVVPGQPLGIYNDTPSSPFESALIFNFNEVGSAIGALVDFGDVGNGLMIEAFDGLGASGSLLASASTATRGAFLGVTAAGIKSARFSVVSGPTVTYLLDDLTYTFDSAVPAVPLPATGVLLIGGMAGMAALKRRQKRRV